MTNPTFEADATALDNVVEIAQYVADTSPSMADAIAKDIVVLSSWATWLRALSANEDNADGGK